MPLILLYGPYRQNGATRGRLYLREDGEYIISEQFPDGVERFDEVPIQPCYVALGLRILNEPLETYERVFRNRAQAIFWFHFAPKRPGVYINTMPTRREMP